VGSGEGDCSLDDKVSLVLLRDDRRRKMVLQDMGRFLREPLDNDSGVAGRLSSLDERRANDQRLVRRSESPLFDDESEERRLDEGESISAPLDVGWCFGIV